MKNQPKQHIPPKTKTNKQKQKKKLNSVSLQPNAREAGDDKERCEAIKHKKDVECEIVRRREHVEERRRCLPQHYPQDSTVQYIH